MNIHRVGCYYQTLRRREKVWRWPWEQMVHWRKTHHNVICSDNSSLAAIAMQNNVFFIQRSIGKTIDLKTLLTLRTRAQSSSFLVSIDSGLFFVSITTAKTNRLKYFYLTSKWAVIFILVTNTHRVENTLCRSSK